MGDIKKPKKKYSKPSHPWQKERIDEEKILIREYGLKNKKEIWRMKSLLNKYASQAKKLTGLRTAQAEVEKEQLISKLISYGFLEENAKLSDILTISINDIMDRRLQSVVVKKVLARTLKQARQFITHQHISVADKKISSPSYLVRKSEESGITFIENSSLVNESHPERIQKDEFVKREEKKQAKQEERAKAQARRRPGRTKREFKKQ